MYYGITNCRLLVVLRISWGYVVLHANKVFINIKNRTVCFQERFRLLSLAAVLRKHPSWFQNPIDIVFWNRNVCFLRTVRSQNPENKSVLFFIYPRLCSMQWFKSVKSVNPGYERQKSKMKLREVCPLTSTNHKALNLLNFAVIS